MPRNYTCKILSVVRHIKSTGESIRKSAETFGINYKAFSRYIKNFLTKKLKEKIHFQQKLSGTPETRTNAQEIMIIEYLLKASSNLEPDFNRFC